MYNWNNNVSFSILPVPACVLVGFLISKCVLEQFEASSFSFCLFGCKSYTYLFLLCT
uniref:Uncharacterized protein n=1 Tax=Arundo donax TaxID=35708 RepID=A0A0A9DGZ2_ARUDO